MPRATNRAGAHARVLAGVLLGALSLANAGSSLAAPSTVLRKATDDWREGERIRVTMADPEGVQLVGWFASLEGDSVLELAESPGEHPQPIPESRIRRLELSVGKKRHTLTGASVGALVGALIGLVVAANEKPDRVTIPEIATVTIDVRPVYPAIGAAAGLVLGGAIGYGVTTDRWEQVVNLR